MPGGALLAAVAAAWLAAVAAAHALARLVGAPAPWRTALVVAAALLAVVPATIARATGDLAAALVLSCASFAAVAFAARRLPRAGTAGAPEGAASPAWPAWPAWIVGALVLALVVHGALTRNFFDEEAHVPFALAIARGVVPPEHPLAAGQVVPYHWGVDALYAQLVLAGLRPDRAIDVVTILSMALLLLAASALGGATRGRAGATLLVILAPLAGSLLALPLHDSQGPFQVAPSMYPKAWTTWTARPPPLTADFFQHPQGLAFPIVLVVLLLATRAERRVRLLGAFVLCLLSLVQAVHFLVLGFGLLASVLVEHAAARRATGRLDVRALLGDTAPLAAALAGAVALGGFFSPSAGTGAALLWGRSFFGDRNALLALAHHVVAFGLPLVLLPLVLRTEAPRRLRVALFAGAGVAFLLPSFVVYAGSWDIVKLFSAGGFLAGVALALTFADASYRHGPARRWRAAVALATAFTVAFPLVWLASRTAMQGRFGIPLKRDWRPRDEVLVIGARVRPLVPARDRVLVNDIELGRSTGLFTPGFDLQRFLNGHLLDFAAARALMPRRSAALVDLDPADLDALGVRWALLSRRDVAKLSVLGQARLGNAERVDVELPGGFTLYRLRP